MRVHSSDAGCQWRQSHSRVSLNAEFLLGALGGSLPGSRFPLLNDLVQLLNADLIENLIGRFQIRRIGIRFVQVFRLDPKLFGERFPGPTLLESA